MPRYDAVLFDLGNTLVWYYTVGQWREMLARCLRSARRAAGLNSADEQVLFDAAFAMRERDDHSVWPMRDRFAELFAPHASLSDEALDAACPAFLEPIFECALLDHRAIETVEAVKRAGLRLGIVSNTAWGSDSPPWRAELVRHGLSDRVDAAVFCADVGFRKPHAAPFRRALDLVGAAPERTAFVGDSIRWDIEGSRALGMTPILVAPTPAELGQEPDYAVARNLDEVLDLLI